jgi:hypothetical protein
MHHDDCALCPAMYAYHTRFLLPLESGNDLDYEETMYHELVGHIYQPTKELTGKDDHYLGYNY